VDSGPERVLRAIQDSSSSAAASSSDSNGGRAGAGTGNRIREVVFCPERVVKDCVHEVLDDRCRAEAIRFE
jgi:hypothetical protein